MGLLSNSVHKLRTSEQVAEQQKRQLPEYLQLETLKTLRRFQCVNLRAAGYTDIQLLAQAPRETILMIKGFSANTANKLAAELAEKNIAAAFAQKRKKNNPEGNARGLRAVPDAARP
jgi:hypothetical protein